MNEDINLILNERTNFDSIIELKFPPELRQTQTNLAPKIDLCHLQCGAKVRQYARVRVQLEVKDGPRLTGDSPNCINEPTSLLNTLFRDNIVPFIYFKKTYPYKKYCQLKQIQTRSFGSQISRCHN